MGTNKSLLPINNKPSISHIADTLKTCTNEVIVIANESQDYTFLNLPIYPDRYEEKGPLAGFESALYNVNASVYVMAACDMPFVTCEVYDYLMSELKDNDIVIPIYRGREHPLSGIYKRTVLPYIQTNIAKENIRMNSFYDAVRVKFIDSFPGIDDEVLRKHFFNMNNPEQYETAKSL